MKPDWVTETDYSEDLQSFVRTPTAEYFRTEFGPRPEVSFRARGHGGGDPYKGGWGVECSFADLATAERCFRLLASWFDAVALDSIGDGLKCIYRITRVPDEVRDFLRRTAPPICGAPVQLRISSEAARRRFEAAAASLPPMPRPRRAPARRAVTTGQSRNVSPSLRARVLERDCFRCRRCGAKAPDVELVVDHITPVAKGGGKEPTNLQSLCRECNAGKRDNDPHAHDLAATQSA
jgi:5-methylcytosine-specific restriction endonuclease McrA